MPTKGPTRIIVETVGAGARSQSASAICAGGVSAVISTSDLDGLTFHPRWVSCHRSNRSLPSLAKPPIVRTACPSSEEGQKRWDFEPLRSAQLLCCWCLGFLLQPWRASPSAAATTATPARPALVRKSGWPASTPRSCEADVLTLFLQRQRGTTCGRLSLDVK